MLLVDKVQGFSTEEIEDIFTGDESKVEVMLVWAPFYKERRTVELYRGVPYATNTKCG